MVSNPFSYGFISDVNVNAKGFDHVLSLYSKDIWGHGNQMKGVYIL